MRNKKQIFDTLTKFSLLFPGEQTREQIQAYTEYLAKHDPSKIEAACQYLVTQERFFPPIKSFVDILEPKIEETDLANQLADKLLDRAFNYSMYDSAINEGLTEDELKIVENFGGWKTLCMTKNDEVGILRAQIRKSCESHIKIHGADSVSIGFEKHKKLGNYPLTTSKSQGLI